MDIAVMRNVGLVSSAAMPFRLTLAGIDLTPPTGETRPAMASLESVSVKEYGPNANGSMEFDLWDPTKAITISGGEEVQFQDTTLDEPLFFGTVESFSKSPAFATGRIWSVKCVDLNVILDRQTVLAEARVQVIEPGGLGDTDLTVPELQYIIGTYSSLNAGGLGSTVTGIYTDNTVRPAYALALGSLRSAIDQATAVRLQDPAGTTSPSLAFPPGSYFVDAYKKIRRYVSATGYSAAPYNISDVAPGGSNKTCDGLTYEVDISQVVNAVYVEGANPTGSGWVRDGASIALYGERQNTLSQTDSDSVAKRDAYGQDFLNQNSAALIRGTYIVSSNMGNGGYAGLHPGQSQTITNSAIGLSSLTVVIQGVETQFQTGDGDREWTVHWGGGLPPSAARLIRKLTH